MSWLAARRTAVSISSCDRPFDSRKATFFANGESATDGSRRKAMADCTLADCADALLMLCLLSMPGETERSVGKREPEQLDPSLPGHLQKPEEARARARARSTRAQRAQIRHEKADEANGAMGTTMRYRSAYRRVP